MKKPVKIALISVAGFLVVTWLVFFFLLSSIASTAVESILPEITKTPVKLESFRVNPLTGTGTIKGFIIGNPEGYDTKSAFELGEVRVDIGLMSLLSDTIVIEEIYIGAPKVTYEAWSTSNIGKILENVEEYGGPPKEDEKPEPEKKEEDAGPGKKILIKRFVMEKGEVSVSIKGLAGKTVTVGLPRIERTNIGGGGEGGDDGKSIAEVSKEIFASVGDEVTKKGSEGLGKLKEMYGDVVTAAQEAFGELGGEAKKLGTKVGKGVTDAGKSATDAGKGVIEGIKGVFGGGDKDKKDD